MENVSCEHSRPAKGEMVVLKEQPDGYMSRHYPVTPGRSYEVLDVNGSCLVTTTDVPGETAHIWRGRFHRQVH